MTTLSVAPAMVESLCWCGAQPVLVEQSMIGVATASCGAGCFPGCPFSETDSFDDEEEIPDVVLVADSGCGCGCGGQLAPKRRFRQGNDARAKSWLKKADAAGEIVGVERAGAIEIYNPKDAYRIVFGKPAPW